MVLKEMVQENKKSHKTKRRFSYKNLLQMPSLSALFLPFLHICVKWFFHANKGIVFVSICFSLIKTMLFFPAGLELTIGWGEEGYTLIYQGRTELNICSDLSVQNSSFTQINNRSCVKYSLHLIILLVRMF